MNEDYLYIKSNGIRPEKGKVLIAEPFTADPFFGRSVVLITDKNNEGTAGIVLNKALNITLGETFSELSHLTNNVYLGGPVSNERLFYLHTLGQAVPNSFHITENIYWGGDFDIILDFLKTNALPDNTIRFFAGYSGWTSKQLEGELQKDFWLVGTLKESKIMKEQQSLWEDCVKEAGKKYQHWLNLPTDPNLN